MNGCYSVCKNYGIAIILFTLVSKIILLPVSIWTHLNSIKMIKIQPDINFLRAKYYGQKDIIDEEQAKLFKKEKYSPLASTIPMIIQLVLLVGVVGVIKLGIEDPNINMNMGSIYLGNIPSEKGLSLLYSPIIAALSSLVLCLTQNASNVLQSEQSKANKYGTMIFSVGLSLYLGWFVPIGTAWYWVWSNLLAVAQMYILNACIKPTKYVDYERLEESRKELAKLKAIGADTKKQISKEDKRKEHEDYKRFFKVTNKHLVFYSESNGFYKYFKGIIEYLLKNTNITIHYITSDPQDKIFELEKENSKIRAYYIGENRLITLMMKMDADVVVMTMPDIDKYHIKRSYVRNDIDYVNIIHGMGSINLTYREGAIDNYDTVFVVGPNQTEELLKTEQVNNLKPKKIVEIGYPLLDDMKESYQKEGIAELKNNPPKIIIAPSWQEDNIVDSCLEQLLDTLSQKAYDITVRPHPQEVRHKQVYMDSLKAKYEPMGIDIQTDFSSHNSVMESDILITDWSDIAYEFAYTTNKPVLFVDTPMKVMNPGYKKIDTVPLNISLRDVIGTHVSLENIVEAGTIVDSLIADSDKYKQNIVDAYNKYIVNHGNASEAGAKYIIELIQKKIKEKKES